MSCSKSEFMTIMKKLGVDIEGERKSFEKVVDKSAHSEVNFSIWLSRAALDVGARK